MPARVRQRSSHFSNHFSLSLFEVFLNVFIACRRSPAALSIQRLILNYFFSPALFYFLRNSFSVSQRVDHSFLFLRLLLVRLLILFSLVFRRLFLNKKKKKRLAIA